MILNLETTKIKKLSKTEYEVLFDLPHIYFDNQNVRVNEVAINWSRTFSGSNARLSCTLIDKSPSNITQQLLFIPLDGSNFTFYTPTHIQEYKIQRPALDSSQFILTIPEKVEIRKIYIQLYFSNARIQQINQKSL